MSLISRACSSMTVVIAGAAATLGVVATTQPSVHRVDVRLVDSAQYLDVADTAVPPIITSYPFELLKNASANLVDANQVLAAGPSDISGLMLQPDAQNIALQELSTLYSAETSLSSFDNGAFADALTPWFLSVDQMWDQGSQALLTADQAVQTAVMSGSGVDGTVFEVFAADFQLAGAMFDSLPVEIANGLVDPGALAALF